MVRKIVAYCSCLLAVGLLTITVQADEINNGQFGANLGSVGGAFGSNIYGQGFTIGVDLPDSTYRLESFGMWLQGGEGEAPLVGIELWADDGFGQPDENTPLVTGTTHQGFLADLTRIDSPGNNFQLNPNTTYYVVINGNLDTTSLGSYNSSWDEGANTIAGGHMDWSNDLGSTWSGGFDGGDWAVYVNVSKIPEPGSFAAVSLLSVVALRRRRR